MDCLLGVDLGTSYFKFALIDRAGSVHGSSRIAVPVHTPLPGRREVDPQEFMRLIEMGISECCQRADIDRREIRGISYSSQANSFVLLDENDRPLTGLILWSDRRAGEPSDELASLWSRTDYLEATGTALRGVELAAAKLDWIRRHESEIWRRTRRVLTISDFLGYLLTGVAAGDTSSGELLGMQDIRTGAWWPPALTALGLDVEQLVTPRRPGTTVGVTLPRLGLPAGIPFAAGALDHYAAAVGSGIGRLADTSESTGTVLACLHLHPELRPAAAYCTAPSAQSDLFYRLAFCPNGARRLELLSRRLGGTPSVEELGRTAALSPPGARGLVARQGAEGMSDLLFGSDDSSYSPGDRARAIMESTALSLDDLLRAACGEKLPKRIIATGGGARSDTWLQIKADLLGVDVLAGENPEPGSFGAALFASVAAGWHPSVEEAVAAFVSPGRRFSPDPTVHRFYTTWAQERRA